MSRKRRDSSWEKPRQAEAVAEESTDNKVDFDGWWAVRSKQIPAQHRKEIVKADFIGRGLSDKESMESYDAALNKYGIKLS